MDIRQADQYRALIVETGEPETASRLEASAVRLFSERWYSSVSVAEICRGANLSNGIFYRYYDNKEAIVRRILEDTILRIERALTAMEGETLRERIASMTRILVRFAREHKDLITVFREGQYRFFEYERRLTELYRRTLGRVLGRNASIADYLFTIGGIRFAAVRAALHDSAISEDAIVDIILNGIFKGYNWSGDKVFNITVTPRPISLNEGSRERLLRAGKRLFGEKGFHEVNIHEITDAAGLSVGAFYRHFTGKESFFEEQIESAGREVRHFITANLSPELNRVEREMQGIFLFGVFLSLDRWCYNIVREGEFVAPAKVREYYAAFEKGYHKVGDEAMDARRIETDPLYRDTAIEFMLGISHYYGIELTFDDSPHNAKAIVEAIGNYLSTGIGHGRQ
ncbi:MAG: TetR/AcrR family transcriptional regulator [Spirochaetota bacterium]